MDRNEAGITRDLFFRFRRPARPVGSPVIAPVVALVVALVAALVAGVFAGGLFSMDSGTGARPGGPEPTLVAAGDPAGAPLPEPPATPGSPESLESPERLVGWLPDPMGAPIIAPERGGEAAGGAGDQIAQLNDREEVFSDEEPDSIDRSLSPGRPKPDVREIEAALAAVAPAVLAWPGAGTGEMPLWRRNAVPVAVAGDGPVIAPVIAPMIALVIDDLGLNRANTRRAIALPAPLTLAFMTYAEGLQDFAVAARAAGHELLVHVPMAPRGARHDPGPNVLREDLGPEELARRLAWGLARFDGYVGINNHMGSDFTSWLPGMAQVMREMKARGLLYLDSMTAPASVGSDLAGRLGVPHARRDVFIDNDSKDSAAIRAQLRRLEELAARHGSAVGIGHPHDLTLAELARWLPEVRRRGFRLVPISAVVKTGTGLAVSPPAGRPSG